MIKAFIIVATSSDLFIAREGQELSTKWTSKEDLVQFIERTKRARVVVMGSKTFATFGNKPLKGRLNIIYSRTKNLDSSSDPERIVETTTDEPAVLLKKLENRGYTEVAICGGSEIYTAFMRAGVVDRIYHTIEPIKFSSGVQIFNKEVPEWKLEKKSGQPTGTQFLEYSVLNEEWLRKGKN
jgi:dihydrofolate reductase